jgi:inorganic triphosphatase YgiF
MPSTTYLARHPGAFAALAAAAALGPLRLDPRPPTRVRDRLFDTDDGALLRDGLVLRVREMGGRRTAGLRALDATAGPLPDDVDLGPGPADRLDLPPGPLARAVWDRAGTARLRPLLSVRQYRAPRDVTAGGRPVGLVSLDVVVYEGTGADGVQNEAEVELATHHRPDDAARLDRSLREAGLAPAAGARAERGLARLRRPLSQPVLLLPSERRRLREAAEGEGPALRLRALVVLLDADGFPPSAIAAHTGLSAAAVDEVRQRFREVRLGVLDGPPVAWGAPDGPAGASVGAPSAWAEAPPPTPIGALAFEDGPLAEVAEDEGALFREAALPPTPGPGRPPRPRQGGGVRPLRRPALGGEAPLLHVAQATVAYHVAAFEAAADRLEAGRTAADARRALVGVHRVRLALESFRSVLPGAAVDRLLAALRPLAADLDRALDAARAAARAADPGAFEDEAARATDAAVARLRDLAHRAWGDRARRLLARLVEQRAAGLLLGDDFPPPPDDFVGDPGGAPAPTRLRHVLGSMLWARYEAVRAFDDEVAAGLTPEAAYRLAVATSALHFVVGLAARASSGPVREAAGALRAAESRLALYRHAHAAARLAAAAGRPAPPVPDASGPAEAWRALAGPSFRQRLGAVVAGV